jgi:hypothetical protein
MLIPDPDLDFLPIPDPGSRGHKGPGRIRNTIFTGMSYMQYGMVSLFFEFGKCCRPGCIYFVYFVVGLECVC